MGKKGSILIRYAEACFERQVIRQYLHFVFTFIPLLCFNKFTTFQRNKSENKMKVLPYHLSFKASFGISNQNASLLKALTNSVLK